MVDKEGIKVGPLEAKVRETWTYLGGPDAVCCIMEGYLSTDCAWVVEARERQREMCGSDDGKVG